MTENDGFIPDTNDGFVEDTQPVSAFKHPIQAFRAYMASGNNPGTTPPAQAFQQDVSGPGAQDATVGDAANLYSLYKTPEAIAGIYNLGKAGAGSLMNFIKTPAAAEALAAPESALEAGTAINAAKETGAAARTTTSNAGYAAVVKDAKLPVTTATSTADSIVNELKDVDSSFHPSGKLMSQVEALQNMKTTSVGALQTMNSTLKDIAVNGEGVEKVYAARLSKALQADLENFGKTSVLPPSQGPSLEAKDLRNLWADTADKTRQPMGLEDISRRGAYINPANVQGPAPLTNSDIPAGVQDANRYYQYKAYLEQHPLTQALNRAHLESTANVIFKGKSLEDLNTAKLLLGDSGYKVAQGQFYNKLLQTKDVGQALSKYTPEFLQEALGAQRVDQLQKLAHFNRVVSLGKKALIAGTGLGATAEAINLLRR